MKRLLTTAVVLLLLNAPALPQTADDDWRAGREPFVPPQMEQVAYALAEIDRISMERLLGSDLHDAHDEQIGAVDDVIVGREGDLVFLVVDVGGFLGLGTHTIALGLDEVVILQVDDAGELRVYVDATGDQLEAIPEYDGRGHRSRR